MFGVERLAPGNLSGRHPALRRELRGAFGVALDLLALLGLAVLPFLYFWRLWASGPDAATFPDGDFTELHLPLRLFVARELAHGHLPLWNPYAFGGASAVGDPQYALYYPVHWLLTRFAARADFAGFVRALEAEAPLHMALAGCGTYLLSRRLFALRAPSLLAAVGFAFGGFATSFPIPQMNILAALAWLPLALWLIHAGAASGNPAPYALAGLAGGLSALAGHPQMAVYVLGTCLLFGVWTAFEGERRLAALAGVVVFAVVAAGVAAVQWLPAFEYLPQTVREGLGYRFAGGGFAPREYAGLILSGLPFTAAALYLGVTLAAFALLGLAAPRPNGLARPWFWAALGGLAVLLSFGADSFLHPALYALLPPLRPIRDQERVAGLLGLAAAILAGYGLSAALADWERARAVMRRVGFGAGALAGAMVLAAVGATIWAAGTAPPGRAPLERIADRLWLAAVFAAAGWGLLAWRAQAPRASGIWGAVVVGVVLLDLTGAAWRTHLADRAPAAIVPPSPLVDAMAGEPAPFRVASEGLLPADGNAGSLYGLEDVVGNSPLAPAAWARFDKEVEEVRRWSLTGARFVVTRRDIADPRLEQVARDGEARLYRYRADLVLPRARFVQSAVVAPSEADYWAQANAATPDFAVLPEPAPFALDRPPSPPLPVEYTPLDTDHVRLHVEAPTNGLVVLGESWSPGWRASNGTGDRVYPILRVDGPFRAIPVEQGTHTIYLTFEPASVAAGRQAALGGLGSAALACVVGAGCWLWGRRRRA